MATCKKCGGSGKVAGGRKNEMESGMWHKDCAACGGSGWVEGASAGPGMNALGCALLLGLFVLIVTGKLVVEAMRGGEGAIEAVRALATGALPFTPALVGMGAFVALTKWQPVERISVAYACYYGSLAAGGLAAAFVGWAYWHWGLAPWWIGLAIGVSVAFWIGVLLTFSYGFLSDAPEEPVPQTPDTAVTFQFTFRTRPEHSVFRHVRVSIALYFAIVLLVSGGLIVVAFGLQLAFPALVCLAGPVVIGLSAAIVKRAFGDDIDLPLAKGVIMGCMALALATTIVLGLFTPVGAWTVVGACAVTVIASAICWGIVYKEDQQ